MNQPSQEDRLSRQGTVNAVLAALAAAALLLVGSSRAADAPLDPLADERSDGELDEVIVRGESSTRRPGFREYQQSLDWLARLVGRFVVDGHVDLMARENPEDILKVDGHVDCVGFGVAPGVQCDLKIRWLEKSGPQGEEIPGATPTLDPAVVLYGFEPAKQGIHHIMVDNKGAAEAAVGRHISADTVQSRSPCSDLAGKCERIVRITAWPDLQSVEMRIDLEVDGHGVRRYQFMLHRVPGTPSVVFGREQ